MPGKVPQTLAGSRASRHFILSGLVLHFPCFCSNFQKKWSMNQGQELVSLGRAMKSGLEFGSRPIPKGIRWIRAWTIPRGLHETQASSAHTAP